MFSFFQVGCYTIIKELCSPFYWFIVWGRIVRFTPFPRVLTLCDRKTASFRIRIWVAESTFDNYNRYATIASIYTTCISIQRCQAAVVSILLYGCTTWTLTKRLEKKLDGNYTRMLRAILNKSWQQHPSRHQLYGHLPPITKTIQARRTTHAGHCWRSKDELVSDVLL